MTDWRDLPPATFAREAKPQPLALFQAPDPTGTPDLFDIDDQADNGPTSKEHTS